MTNKIHIAGFDFDLTEDEVKKLRDQIDAQLEKSKDPFGHLPRKWEADKHSLNSAVAVSISYKNEFVALCRLIELRDEWREGWSPREDDQKETIWVVWHELGVPCVTVCNMASPSLSFDTREKATAFLETFRDLIETAKPLL